MQVFKLRTPRPELDSDVTRLWLGPGLDRVGAVLGEGIRNNFFAVCWGTVADRVLWEAVLFNEYETFPDPDFDPELKYVVSTRSPDRDEQEPAATLALRAIGSSSEVRLGGFRANLPAITPDSRNVLAVALNTVTVRLELRRWELPPSVGVRKTKPQDAVTVAPDPDWAIRLPSARARFDREPTAVAVSPDGRFVACGRRDGSASVWNLANRREVAAIPALKMSRGLPMLVSRLSFSSDGGMLATLRRKWISNTKQYGSFVSVWLVSAGKQLKGPKEKVSVNGMAFSPDGQMLLTARDDGRIAVWDTSTWKLRHEYAWKIGKLFSVAFSPDGLTCAAGVENGQVVVWDVDQ
jgi:WD40 repeat protein